MRARQLSEMQRDLKPCPFCGGRAKLDPMRGTQHWWRARCGDYDCGATTWALQGVEAAAQAWNRRVDGTA